ncbi:MAG: repeat domain protein [Labilithrix sp.]|nr:repeat domain protein [Labilithrix sp.]
MSVTSRRREPFAAPVVMGRLACAVALSWISCTSAIVDVEPPPRDDLADGAPPSAPAADAAASDVVPSDAAPSEPLQVVCEEDPCYLAVNGNGGRHLCGLLRDGTVRCWGRDTMAEADSSADGGVTPIDGALGRGKAVTALEGATPAPVVGLTDVTQISVGPNLGTCARTSNGSVYCWGRNEFGQLGRPANEESLPLPTRVEGLPPADEVALGYRTGCAIASSDRALYCWGELFDGLGVDGGGATTFSPQLVTTFRPPLKAVAVGTWTDRDTIVGLLDGNILASIGEAPAGQRSTKPAPSLPHEIAGVARIGPFAYVEMDGSLTRWRLTYDPYLLPVAVHDAPYLPFHAEIVDAKAFATNQFLEVDPWGNPVERQGQGAVLIARGRLFRWGYNATGALGVPPEQLSVALQPTEVTQVKGKVVSFAMTFDSTCASLVDGKVVCWGANTFGELGRGTIDVLAHPQAEVIR